MTTNHHSILIFNDLEFSGNIIGEGRNFVLSWATLITDGETGDELYENIVLFKKPPNGKWNPDTYRWAVSNIPKEVERIEFIKNEGETREDGTKLKVNWLTNAIEGLRDNHPNVCFDFTFVGDTSASDSSWMNYYLGLIEHEPLQTYWGQYKDIFNISTYYAGLAQLDPVEIDKLSNGRHFSERKYVREKLNIPFTLIAKIKHDHNPLHDCKYMAEEYWIIKRAMLREKEKKHIEVFRSGEEKENIICA